MKRFIALLVAAVMVVGLVGAFANQPIMPLPEMIGEDWEFFGFNSYEHMQNQGRSIELTGQIQENFPIDENFNVIVWPDWFGGLYLNYIGNLVIQVVNTDEAIAEAVEVLGAIVDLAEIIFERVEFSEMYLMSIVTSFHGLWDDGGCDIAQNISGFGLDTMNNRVEIGLIVYNEYEIARFRENISDSPAINFTHMERITLDSEDGREIAVGEEIQVLLNGETMQFDVPPMIMDNRTMVPMRAIFEALGAEIMWDGEHQTIAAFTPAKTINLAVDDNIAIIFPADLPMPGGEPEFIILDVPPTIVDNRTLVPLRFVSEALGATVDWDDITRTVIIEEGEPTVVFDFGDGIWRIDLAEELIPEYASYIEFIEFEEFDGEPHQRIAIAPYQIPMRDFRWIEIGLDDEAEDWRFMFYERSVIYEAGDIEPRTLFVVTWMNWGTLPHRGISFVDPFGVRRYFTLNTNNAYPYDGPPSMYMLNEFGR